VLHTGTIGFVMHAGHKTAMIQTRKRTMEKKLQNQDMMLPHHNSLQPFSGTIRVSWRHKRTSGLYDASGKINRGRHADHPVGRHSIQINQCPPPPSPIFYRTGALPAAQPTVSNRCYDVTQTKYGKNYMSCQIR